MKGKDKRIVNICIPATEESKELSFFIELYKLEMAVKAAIEDGNEAIGFKVGKDTIDMPLENVKQIVKVAKSQIKAKIIIPSILAPYLEDLSLAVLSGNNEKLSAREEEIEKAWTFLYSNQKSNAILVGDHGVGKTTMVMEMVQQISFGKCPKPFLKYNVLKINTFNLLEMAERSEFRYKRVIEALKEFAITNRNCVIFYIDNLFHIKCDLELLKAFITFIETYNVKLIASIYTEDFEEYFEKDTERMKYLNPILIEEPDVEEIYPMLKSRINQLQKSYGVKISERMIHFSIFTGLHLSSSNAANPESTLDVINFDLADAKRKEQKEVTKLNILSYYDIDFKLVKKTSKNEKLITSYHESGHYLVSRMSNNLKDKKNSFVSILPIGGTLGLTASYLDVGEQLTYSKEYYIDEIASCLGGRVGEAIYTNKFSSGAQSDLMYANSMAEKLIMSYGLSETESEKNKSYTAGNYVKDFLLTDEIRMKIHDESSKILDEAYKRAESIINDNREVLEEIVKRLIEDGVLIGDELEEICQKYQKN